MNEHTIEKDELTEFLVGALVSWAGEFADLDDCRSAAAYLTPRLAAYLHHPNDAPHVGLFNRFEDAVAEASFRAAVCRHRQRVRWEPNNRWWQITDAWPNTRVTPSVVGETP